MDKTPLNISLPLRVWGSEDEYVELNAILPTLIKEVYLDGQITKYLRDEEVFTLPYLLKNRVSIHDFNKEGYSEYECFNVGILYETGSIEKWKQGGKICTKDITIPIPPYICLAYGIPENRGSISKMLYWDYSVDNSPKEVAIPFNDMAEFSILFQDLRQINDDLECIPPITNNDYSNDDWESAWDLDDKQEDGNRKQNASLLYCYDIATKYKTYYFIFNPLLNMTSEEFINDICIPLRKRLSGSFTEEDMQNLMRCATECGLDWIKISKIIYN